MRKSLVVLVLAGALFGSAGCPDKVVNEIHQVERPSIRVKIIPAGYKFVSEEEVIREKYRVSKWIEKGEITVGAIGEYATQNYAKPLERIVDEINDECEDYGIALPKLVYQKGKKPEELDIALGQTTESDYFMGLRMKTKGMSVVDWMRLAKGAATLMIDEKGSMEHFSDDYDPNKFVRVEITMLYKEPREGFLKEDFRKHIGDAVYVTNGEQLQLSDEEKLEFMVDSTIKHEIYHGLGIFEHNENREEVTLMTEGLGQVSFDLGKYEWDALQRIYGER